MNNTIAQIVICKDIISEKNIELVDPILMLEVPFLPTVYSFKIFVNFYSEKLNDGKEHSIRVSCLNKDTEELIIDSEGPTIIPTEKFHLGMHVNEIILKNKGTYEVLVYIDGEKISSQSFEIKVSKQNEEGDYNE
ncbi:DUF6941 family protein [Facklamia hominis]|uniref:Uncharacterized protein n=1 Tax=Facklamia hominis CCUG 36813 TaxID=883111 RepID=K1MEF9_9LACT|nr:hypothetical protein [Facklamia hominis]EKB54444.1 hypothetical protein HMPREF9706_00634 [Facklamia hominis CCUG 36813]